MGKDSKIQWTDHTFNPWWGCAKVSPGCEHCYAETFSKRTGHSIWGVDASRRFFGEKHWNEPLRWDSDAAKAGEKRFVFCASMADWAERHRNPETQLKLTTERARLAQLIKRTPHLVWLMLTKRPSDAALGFDEMFGRHIPMNVLMGITAENQEQFNKRIAIAQSIYDSTTLRGVFISAEPLLGAVTLGEYPEDRHTCIKWVIVGGESGPGARPMHPDWARGLRDECVNAGISFHFKQWGEWTPGGDQVSANCALIDDNGARHTFMRKVGKKCAGRLLDGREWNEAPKL